MRKERKMINEKNVLSLYKLMGPYITDKNKNNYLLYPHPDSLSGN